MKYETKMDIIELTRAYLGAGLLTSLLYYNPWGFII